MRFRPWGTYTHENMLDCVFTVIKAYEIAPSNWALKVRWGTRRGLDLNITETIRIRSMKGFYQWPSA